MTSVITAGEIAAWWPVPGVESRRYMRGIVGIGIESPRYPGAALLAISGALGVDSGVVRYLESAPRNLVMGRPPNVMLIDGQVQAVAAGSDWGALIDAGPRLREALERWVPLVTDAGALRLLPADLPVEALLTPRVGGLARLLGVGRGGIEVDSVVVVVLAAGRFDAMVLLKGAVQPMASPDDFVRLALSGPAWTAQAGSGDVLAGVCGILLTASLLTGRAGLMVVGLQALTASCLLGPYSPDAQASCFPEVVWGLLAPDQ